MIPHQDPGLQPQRTALAWNRTGLSMAAVALLMLRAGIQEHDTAALAVGALDMACALMMYAAAFWRRSSLHLDRVVQAPPAWMAGISGAVALACAVSGWLILR